MIEHPLTTDGYGRWHALVKLFQARRNGDYQAEAEARKAIQAEVAARQRDQRPVIRLETVTMCGSNEDGNATHLHVRER